MKELCRALDAEAAQARQAAWRARLTSDKRWVEYNELLDNIDSAHLERELEKYRKKEKHMAAAAKAKRQREE